MKIKLNWGLIVCTQLSCVYGENDKNKRKEEAKLYQIIFFKRFEETKKWKNVHYTQRRYAITMTSIVVTIESHIA